MMLVSLRFTSSLDYCHSLSRPTLPSNSVLYSNSLCAAPVPKVYSDDRLGKAVSDLIHRETDDMACIKAAEQKKDARKQFMV